MNGHACVEIRDDGVGGADAGRGSGLRGLADRVAALDGTLALDSPAGRGTRVRAEIPCAPRADAWARRAGVTDRSGRRLHGDGSPSPCAADNARVDPLGRADLLVGRAIERAMEAHHRYRLRRHGRLEALAPADDGPWCREAPPPRDGSAIDVLVDGDAVLGAIAEATRGARRSVRIAG